MKRFLNFILCSVFIMTVSSCSFFEEENSKDKENNTSSIEGLSPAIKAHFVEQDSLMNDLVNKVDTLAAALNQTKTENSGIKEELEKIQSPRSTWAWLSIGAIILSVIAIILALYRRGLSEQEIQAIVKDRLDESKRINDLIFNVNTLKNDLKHNSHNSSSSSNLEYRLQNLEKTLQEVVAYTNTQRYTSTSQQTSYEYSNSQYDRKSEVIRVGYVNINTGKYFTKIFDSKQETCVFSIKFENERKGEFTIISLDKIKSRNGWQEVIEYTGSIEDASNFKEIEKGVCEKYDETTWVVTKPLRIRLI